MIRVLVLLVCLSTPAVADGSLFYPPQGCTGYLTVQQANCTVSQHWTCEKDPQGVKWRADMRQSRVVYVSKTDKETQWLESYDFSPIRQSDLVQPATDPASLTELLNTGVDSFDFILVDQTTRTRTRVVGYDRITEYDVSIDGEPLHRTEFSVRFVNPGSATAQLEVEGSEYVSATHRRFFGGLRTRTSDGPSEVVDSTPVQFIYPGEDGFFAKTPLYGCSLEMAFLSDPSKGPKP